MNQLREHRLSKKIEDPENKDGFIRRTVGGGTDRPANEAIGFIRIGQRADISLTAFNASDYGYLPATVKRVGSDALTPQEQQRELGTDAQGLHFPATLKLNNQALQVGTRSIDLQPGMSLTADLHIRTRRFISAITDLFDDKRRSLERLP